jgi:cytochrome c oxidase subunit II
MQSQFRLFPEQASTVSLEVDHLLYYLLVVSVFFTILIFGAILYFAIRYRRRPGAAAPHPGHTGLALEVVWSVIPFGLTMIMFGWGAEIFFKQSRPPANAMQIYVVGKQWMWKLQHQEGQREINELHIPINRPIKLLMTSEDVIHDFFIPDFRTKQDVVPGRYTTEWFIATKPGKYHIFCAQYCGTKHSGMIGWVYAMEPQDYQEWLAGGPTGSMADAGARLFDDLACGNCHKPDGTGRCPNLVGLYGSTVKLAGGGTVKADEAYIRESILNPPAKVVEGYQPLMPTFQGLVTEEGVVQLIEYIKSLSPPAGQAQPTQSTVPAQQSSPASGLTPGNR